MMENTKIAHFDFKVSLEDAENIFHAIRTVINKNNETIQKLMVEQHQNINKNNEDIIKHYKRDNQYYEELMKQMKCQVENIKP